MSESKTTTGGNGDTDINQILISTIAGKNLLLVGSAGTSKTSILKRIVGEKLSRQYNVCILDSTQAGAKRWNLGLGGSRHPEPPLVAAMVGHKVMKPPTAKTIYDWLGLGRVMYEKPLNIRHIFQEILLHKSIQKTIASVQVLVINNLQWMTAEWFSVLDAICQACSENKNCFGGKQVILAADYMASRIELDLIRTKTFNMSGFSIVGSASLQQPPSSPPLSDKVETSYRSFLQRLRIGIITEQDRAMLTERSLTQWKSPTRTSAEQKQQQQDKEGRRGDQEEEEEDQGEMDEKISSQDLEAERPPMHVFPTKKRVDETNTWYFQQLKGESHNVASSPDHLQPHRQQQQQQQQQTGTIGIENPHLLKQGARVRLTQKIEIQVVNSKTQIYPKGLVGTVVSFWTKKDPKRATGEWCEPIVRFDTKMGHTCKVEQVEKIVYLENGRIASTIKHCPLELAFSTTLYSVQGSVLPRVSVSIDKETCFAAGLSYSLCSLVRSEKDLYLLGPPPITPPIAVGSAQLALGTRDVPWYKHPLLGIDPTLYKYLEKRDPVSKSTRV